MTLKAKINSLKKTLEVSDTSKHEFVKIAVLESVIEAQLIGSILSDQKIPHRIRSFYDTAYNGLFQFQKGWGELQAPKPYKQELLKTIEYVRSTDHSIKE